MTEVLSGFILSRQWQDDEQVELPPPHMDGPHQRKKMQLIFWLKTDVGAVKLVVDSEYAVFFLANDYVNRATALLQRCPSLKRDRWFCRELSLKDFDHKPVNAVYFSRQRDLYIARDFLKKNDVMPYEADIQPTERYLMERFIAGAMKLEGELHSVDGHHVMINPKVAPLKYLPQLHVVSLDIETSMSGNRLYSIAAYTHSYFPPETLHKSDAQKNRSESIVFMCGHHTAESNFVRYHENESDMLCAFLQWFTRVDPDVIIGWNVINFDLRFLQKKAEALGIAFSLGRENTAIDWRQSRDDRQHFTLTIPGRAVLDGIDTLKSATYVFESFSLQYVASALLNRGKLIHEVNDRGQEITRLFNEDKLALAKYNLEDCKLVWDIFLKTDLFRFSLERSMMTGLSIDRFGGSVAAFDNQYLPRLHRKGYVAPVVDQNPEGVGSPGGYVMTSCPGIYNNVFVLDFKSLYPSIIRTFKIDPLALVANRDAGSESSPIKVPGFNGASFDSTLAILPELIEELWGLRDLAKKQGNQAMSQVIKILMNSFYGVLGTPGCRFFDSRLPSSITLRGHEILQRTKSLVETLGYQVIYGDTDSLFVWVQDQPKDAHRAQLFSVGAKLTATLNTWWQAHMEETFGLTSHLELEFESCFSVFVMPTIRGAELGSKKRYAGLKVTDGHEDKKGELVFKGLETVRTDWTVFAREFQRELYRRIFFDEPYEDFIRQSVCDVYEGKCDDKLVYRKRIRRPLADYIRNVPPHVQAARIADKTFMRQGFAAQYSRGGWIQYVLTVNGPEPLECRTSPLDYELYVERQLMPIVDGIVQFLGNSFDKIAGKQLGLF